jgi:hypothetical protein
MVLITVPSLRLDEMVIFVSAGPKHEQHLSGKMNSFGESPAGLLEMPDLARNSAASMGDMALTQSVQICIPGTILKSR